MKSCMLGFYAALMLWLLVLFSIQDARIISSCLTTSDTKVPLKNLLNYTIQSKPLFSVDAARFLTIKRKTICSDPSSSWAKNAMNYLDQKNKKQQSVSNKTARQSVTQVPVNTSTTNRTQLSAQI
ncbi:C-C motif chemokine 2-like isoform X2 [Carassius gibelio]|uniref:C-C motif chemokine 2-like isoform X2 n=1 Tax=Carassius gibelio TaxID=101364 RepID=UPI002278779E|nr:C-C motif chemokine 2-like isoform X2 [Carassius gibelio]